MTDADKWIAFLAEMGVEAHLKWLYTPTTRGGAQGIELEANSQDRVKGYSFFSVVIEFDKDGKFVAIGAWE